MVEEIVINYLNDNLSVPVYAEEPINPPSTYVIVEKTNENKNNFIYSSMMALQSYAESLFMAARLNEEVKTWMDKIIILDDICKSKLNSDYNFTDPDTKRYRYQAVYDLVHY